MCIMFSENIVKKDKQPISQKKFNAELRKNTQEKRTNQENCWLVSFNHIGCAAMSLSVPY